MDRIYKGAALRENLISIKPTLMNFDFLLPIFNFMEKRWIFIGEA